MAIPTELVGSLPRPMKLQQAYADYDEGKITWEQLAGRAGRRGRGLDPAPGGDRRADRDRRRAARVELRDLLRSRTRWPAPGWPTNLAGDGQFFAIFDDGHHRQLPRLTGGPFRYKTYASEFVEKNVKTSPPIPSSRP